MSGLRRVSSLVNRGATGCFVIVGVVGLIISVVAVAILFGRASASADWPSVTGRIVSAEVRRTERRRSSGSRTDAESRRRTSITYVHDVVYRYEVGGTTYESEKVQHVGWSYASQAEAEAALAEKGYAAGAAVAVYYDPDEPARCILVPGTAGGLVYMTLLLPVTAFLMLLVAIVLWLRARRAART